MFVFFVIKDSSSIITATFLSIKLYLTLRRHMNQIQLTQVAQNEQGKSDGIALRVFDFHSLLFN